MPKPRGKKTTPASNGGLVPTQANNDALITLVSAETQVAIDAILVGGPGWRRRGRRAPAFGNEYETFVTMGDPDEKLTDAEEDRAWAQVLQLDEQTALTLIYAAARFLAVNADPGLIKPATIKVNEILEYRGYARQRKGDFKTSVKIEERRRFAKLSRMYVVRRIGKLKRRPDFETSQLLVVTIRSGSSSNDSDMPLPYLDEPSIGFPYEFDVQLGSWAQVYLQDPRRHVMLTKILGYDANKREQRMALRLGLALHFKPSRTMTVRELLAMAHIEMIRPHPEEFRDAFETAMDTLERDLIIGKWRYLDAPELPRYRWIDLWLDWRLDIMEGPIRISETTPPARSLR
jgi:hypothetical protein